ncbi:unnamed protein product [Pieris brassicae]|uniref:Uncharacterized protein n=1 Tax=Pieris brassicae TaxID=7116 RepID=A0A9P0XFW9_PIEBR|nr:unnamed protein product [Pieris brassicae]
MLKKLLIIMLSLLFVLNTVNASPMPRNDDPNFDFQIDENGIPKGWFFGKCDGCKIHNIGNGEGNTNTVYIKDK